ncbi:MAG TPA: sugar ABC transporter substrate-binding protein [Clostridiales bacterium]|nr:sugar ABC transporter substrate-binding protein [Clostridiales bacterium]
MKKKIISAFLGMAMAASVIGCSALAPGQGTDPSSDGSAAGSGASSDGEVQVGIVLPTRDEPRWIQDEASFTSILGDAGFSSEVLFSQGSSATELTNVESLIEKGIDVLVICAQDATAAAQAVEFAHENDVTVICYDRLITDTDAVDYYVTFNSYDVGVQQGQYLIDAYAGQTNVPLYLYSGATTDNNAFIFFAGAWSVLSDAVANGQFTVANCDAISAYAGQVLDVTADHETLSNILGTITTNWDFNTAKSLAEANLVSNDASLKGDCAILAPNDGTARAIADAFSADPDVSSFVITGQDCETASLGYICSGLQSMTIWKNTAELASTTCDMVNDILNNGTPATSTTYNNGTAEVPSNETPVTVITIDNINAPVDAGYVDAADIEGYPG